MQAIVIKYIQLFCVAVLFDNVSCDQIVLKNYKDDWLFYKITSCTASCLQKNSNKTLTECYERVCDTPKFNQTEPKPRNDATYKIVLLCRSDTFLVIEIVDTHDKDVDDTYYGTYGNHSGNYKYSRNKQEKGNLYMVKVERGNLLSQKIFYITESPVIQINNLTSNATYHITATVMHSNYQYTNAVKFEPIATLASGYKPGNLKNLTKEKNLSKFQLSKTSNMTLDTVVSWEPTEDRTCHYYILSYDMKEKNLNISTEWINKPEVLYRYPIKNLRFESEIMIGVEPANNLGGRSRAAWIEIKTPTCWDWYKNDTNLEICQPYPPRKFVVSATSVSRNNYKMNISWEKPDRLPTSYSVVISDYNNTNERVVQGDSTGGFFEDILLSFDDFQVKIEAISLGGRNSNIARFSLHDLLTDVPDSNNNQTLRIMLYMGCSIIAVMVVGVLIATFIHLKAKSRRRQYREDIFKELDKQRPVEIKNEDKRILLEEEIKKSFVNDGMEIDEDDIDIRDIIGEGAFGFVSRGILLPTGKEVAVKRLKDVVTFDIMQSFCQEVEVMRSVDRHPNIVGIIGHCMKNIEKMMILTEYCSEGNLLDFLRNYWQKLMKCSTDKTARTNKANIAEDCSFRKPIESEFNFGSSIPEKHLMKQKNLHCIDDTLPVCIKNLIINKLYDECSDNFDSKQFHVCGNSCKSYVDIIDEGYNNDKVRVSVKDCDCRENKKNKMLNYLDQSNLIVENPGYDQESKINKVTNGLERTLTRKDLLSFALQIATGMEFLSFNKVVHRDLAARNVCVCSDYTVKIADFGLSRDIYQENVYKKATEGKLPIKWLALESMTFQMYNSQSDVWSYGILLYEIVTLGSIPYPSIQTENLLKLLMSGYRMEKPPNCDDNIYELMLSCWRDVPSERPTFTQIKLIMERLLSEFKDNQPMYNNKMFENNLRSISSSGSYLKPI